MCGIAGAMFWDDTPVDTATRVVSAMVAALSHRGPDGDGVAVCARRGEDGHAATVVLGHRRLAIIDLSAAGAQPMTACDRTLTFNGEIYNFTDVRRALQAEGHVFRSGSDTEVLLHAFDAWGTSAVDRLQGMFAFALWDAPARSLHLVRDRLGIKPIYVWRGPRVLLFASEIRALLASGLVPRRLNVAALDRFLTYQTVPTPDTLVTGVHLIRPAVIATADQDGRVDERSYWDLLAPARQRGPQGRDDAHEEVRARLEEAARLHLVSDVPVSLFLSGGIDSSALVALVRRLGVRPSTIGIAFPGTAYDEAPYARAMAAAFDTDHLEVSLTEAELLTQLPEALQAVDHPSGDGINTFVVSKAAKQAGYKVAWSGLGGDEFFGGYPSFARLGKLAAWRRAWRGAPSPLRAMAATAVRSVSGSVAAEKAAALLESDGSVAETYPVLRQLFPAVQRRALIGDALVDAAAADGDPYVRALRAAFEQAPEAGLMSLVSFAEARSYMHDVLLRDTDQMSMRHGLEIRVPFLDHKLVECLMRLPDAVKASRVGTPKALLVDSLGVELPGAIVNRPKRGFVLPFEPWMRGELREFCDAHLGASGLAGRGVFNGDAVARLWTSFQRGETRTTWARLWALVALDAWLAETGVTP